MIDFLGKSKKLKKIKKIKLIGVPVTFNLLRHLDHDLGTLMRSGEEFAWDRVPFVLEAPWIIYFEVQRMKQNDHMSNSSAPYIIHLIIS